MICCVAVIVLSGLPGSGKTTFAGALAARTPIEHVESDAIRRGLFPRPTYSQKENAEVFDEVERRVVKGLGQGRLVVVDATNLKHEFRRRYFELADEAGTRVVYVNLTAPIETLRERVSGPREGYSQAGVPVLDSMVRAAERHGGAALVVDTRFDIGVSVEAALLLAGVQA